MQVVERNKPGRGRKNRVAPSLDNITEVNLGRLAVSCGMHPTTLAYLLIRHCLSDATVVDLFQMDFNTNPAYWVMPVTHRDGNRRLEVKGVQL